MSLSISSLTDSPLSNQACTSTTTLSGGSAAFILIALILGALAQPGGSLVVSSRLGSWRVWRLSPLLCGLEGITIFIILMHARLANISQRRRAFEILAIRTTGTHNETRSLVEYLERPKLELIVPMMLQIWKVFFIRGSWLTKTTALLFWIDWAVVQYCHCWVWLAPLVEERPQCQHDLEYRKIEKVCERKWVSIHEGGDSIEQFARVAVVTSSVLLWASNILQCWWLIGVLSPEKGIFNNWRWYSRWSVILLIYSLRFSVVGFLWMGLFFLVETHPESPSKALQHTLWRFGAVCITFVAILTYYKFVYDEVGTYKPAWLDWFG